MGLRFAPGVQDFVRTLAPEPKKRIRAALQAVSKDPRAAGLDIRVLRTDGPSRYFRLRVGDYRVIFSPRGRHTHVWRIVHRSEGYEWLDRLDP